MDPYFIGIAGPSCSGKSEVSRRLARLLRAPTLVIDHYYRDLACLPFEERIQTNFDDPASMDEELILEHARALKHGLDIDQPTYDFSRHTRADVVELIQSAPFVILEGLFALHWAGVRALIDTRVYIDADHDICLERRIFRDVRERGRTEESVRLQYEETVRPMCDCYVSPTKQFADLVLCGTDPIKQSVYRILLHVAGDVRDALKREAVEWSLSALGTED